jgi:hypothetical protein
MGELAIIGDVANLDSVPGRVAAADITYTRIARIPTIELPPQQVGGVADHEKEK